MAAGVGQPGRGLAHGVGAFVAGGGDDLAVVEGARPAPEQSAIAGQRTARGRGRADMQRLAPYIAQAGREVQRPVAGVRVDGLDGDVTRLVDPVLAGLCDPGEPLRYGEAVVVDFDRIPAVMALGPVVGQVDIALAVDVAAPTPEVLAVQVGDRHLDALVPDVVMRAVVGDQVAGQRVDGVEERLGRLGLGHVGVVDVAEERHSLPLQFQRGEAGRAVTVRGGLFVAGVGKRKSHGSSVVSGRWSVVGGQWLVDGCWVGRYQASLIFF